MPTPRQSPASPGAGPAGRPPSPRWTREDTAILVILAVLFSAIAWVLIAGAAAGPPPGPLEETGVWMPGPECRLYPSGEDVPLG